MTKAHDVPLRADAGMLSAGDSASIPDGHAVVIENHLSRPNRLPKRPPFVYDALTVVNGLANFIDPANKVTRLLAIDTARAIYEKATSGEGWSASLATIAAGSRLSDYSNFRGVLYGMLDDGSGLPSKAFSFDGTNVVSSPFNSAIAGRAITAAKERVFIGYPRVTVTPANSNQTATTSAYDWSSGARWTPTNITISNIAIANGNTYCRLFPTSTAASGCQIEYTGLSSIGLVTVAASAADLPYVWQQFLKNNDAANDCPYTLEIRMSAPINAVVPSSPHTFAAGDVITSGGFIQRCTTAGTENSAFPAFNGTKGGTTVWDTVTFTNEGSDVIASMAGVIPNATASPNGITRYLKVNVPRSSGCWLNPRLKLYNTDQTALTILTPIDISLKDGLADGDVRKANRGLQITAGDFYYPFFNTETATSATIDMRSWVWSEPFNAKAILNANSYEPQGFSGDPTGACFIGERLIGFYRSGLIQWVFTDDPDNPIRFERSENVIGNLGSLSHDEFENETFFVGESDLYRYKVGDENPMPFCGDGMREEIMNKGANWVESQSTYKRPILKIDKSKLLVYVYTQKAKLYVFDLRSKAWARFTMPNNAEIDAMLWNQNTGNFYVAFGGHGLTRLDYSTTANDTYDGSADTFSGTAKIIFRPMETPNFTDYAGRKNMMTKKVHFFHAATADQTGQTFKVSYSRDKGATFPNYEQGTLTLASTDGDGKGIFREVVMLCQQQAASMMVKTEHTGKFGETAFSLSPVAYAELDVLETAVVLDTGRTVTGGVL